MLRWFGKKKKRRIEWGATGVGGGYSAEGLVRTIGEKTCIRREELRRGRPVVIDSTGAGALIGVALCGHPWTLRVLDFGGGFGIHYFTAIAVLGQRFRWRVVELPAVVDGAEGEDHHLEFFASVEDACGDGFVPDLVFSSGALAYTLRPYHALQELLCLGSRYFYLTRVVMAGEDLWGVQHSMLSDNGPGPLPAGVRDAPIEYPLVVPRRKRIEGMLAMHYRRVLCFEEDYFFGLRQYGYFCSR